MQKSYNTPFSQSPFKKVPQTIQEPIYIKESQPKSYTPPDIKQFRHPTQNCFHDRKISISHSFKHTPFITNIQKHSFQPQEISTSLIFHRKSRTVERIQNSKDKNLTQLPSKHCFDKMSRYNEGQKIGTKNSLNKLKKKTFNNFLHVTQQQNQKQKSRISFRQNPKLQKYKPHSERLNLNSLRQTEDTIPESLNLTKNDQLQINHFELIKLLGKGKNGQVHLAIHKTTRFACAIKIIKKRTLERQCEQQKRKAQEQLLNQIKIQMYLQHNNLIELYGVFKDTQNIYLIQQLGVNGQLYELMKKRTKFSQETTALLANDVISGIEFMHSQKVIHRDLKPQNMVLIYGVCKICDFGWSIYNHQNDLRSTLCGTLLYMPPEMLCGNTYNQKIDIWAYGILVYELFTGQNPFRIEDKSDLNRVITEDLAISHNMPQKLKHFLLQILIKQLGLRPKAEEIRKHKWLQIYKDLETSEELSKI